jgi:hypothetical protein
MLATLLLWWTTAFAARGGYYLEAPPAPDREAAAEVGRAADAAGLRSRVVRRYVHGEGWRYVVLVEGFSEAVDAEEAAGRMATATGLSVTVFSTENDQATRLSEVAPSTPEPVAPVAGAPDVETLLDRAAVAHGGSAHPAAGAPNLRYVFRRRAPDGLDVGHLVVRRGDALYVEIDPRGGDAVPSRTWVRGASAWVSVDGGAPEAKDATWTREQLAVLFPEALMALPLSFGAARQDTEFRAMYLDGEDTVDEARCYRLRFDGDRNTTPRTVYLDRETLLVRRVESAGVVQEFSAYRDVAPGRPMPFRVKVIRDGAVVDDVEIVEFDLAPSFPADWFGAPG